MNSISKSARMSTTSPDAQERILRRFIAISLLGHVFFFLADRFDLFHSRLEPLPEWEIEADLMMDSDLPPPNLTALPDAKIKEEAAAPSNMLPQLTKKFVVQEKTTQNEEMAEEVIPEKEAPLEAEKDKNKDSIRLQQKKDDKELNKLKMKDALKRLALERLRRQKEAKSAQAQKKDSLAKIAQNIEKNSTGGAAGFQAGKELDRYRKTLQKSVRRHYAIPEAYNLKEANLIVVIEIVLNDRGQLMKSEVHTPSGDGVFDEMAFQAVRNAAPLPVPPKGTAGEPIHLQFTPRSF